jgi:hypothetical protein
MKITTHMKSLLIKITILLFATVALQGQNISLKNSRISFPDTSFIPKDTSQLYSIFQMFKDSSIFYRNNKYEEAWYTLYLYALKEPILFTDKSRTEVYRFTWLRTFHNPISIRIEKNNDSYFLSWKLSSGAGGYEPGQMTIDKHKQVGRNEWENFIKLIDQIDFWNLKTDKNNFGLDGSSWILEGKTSLKYHVVDVWTPNKMSKYYQCCDYLISLTDFKIKESEKY